MPTRISEKQRISLMVACWLPVICLVAVELYVRKFYGWGAWSTGPLFLFPLILSVVIVGVGIVLVFSEIRVRAVRTSTAFSLVLAMTPFLWLLIRRYVI